MCPSPTPFHAGSDIQVEVFAASDFSVIRGICTGDSLGLADQVNPGDVYALTPGAQAQRILIPVDGQANAVPAANPVARHHLMSSRGESVMVVVLHRNDGLLILPQSPLLIGEDYTLIEATPYSGPLEGLGSVIAAFSAGTAIILADGSSRPIERLQPGDLVLTRDHGGQPLRWIGQSSLAGGGPLAPIVFRAGCLGNLDDLIVAPTQRMFVFPHEEGAAWAGLTGARHGVLIEARHLVDSQTICPLPEGIVDLFALVFDQHEVIYAEGIPCESHLVTEATLRQIPEPMARELRDRFPAMRHRPHYAVDAGR
ncbi:Hint domain-containing protein [Paracoccus sp. p4-l81]|uniref:Hint domain-containing protein n=1 Tax=unclassified Paracoccus (in: a-proteobacteria) TaxID=2688777 RepID=UPI0035B9218A